MSGIDLNKFLNKCNNQLKIYNEKCTELENMIKISTYIISKKNPYAHLNNIILDNLKDCCIKLLRSANSMNVLCPKNLEYFKVENLFYSIDIDVQTIATIARNMLEVHKFSIYISGIKDFKNYSKIDKDELSFRNILYQLHSDIDYIVKYNSMLELTNKKAPPMELYLKKQNIKKLNSELITNSYYSMEYNKHKKKDLEDNIKSIIENNKLKNNKTFIYSIDNSKFKKCFDLSFPEKEYNALYSIFCNNVHFNLAGRNSEKVYYDYFISFIDILTLAVDTASVCLETIIELINKCYNLDNDEMPLFNVDGLKRKARSSFFSEWAITKIENLK